MPNGYWGRVLFVNLSTGHIEEQTLPDEVYRQYLGGYGLGVRMLYEHIPPGTDPLGPDNMLGFLPGLLTGTHAPFSGRFMVVAKSPLTGGWGEANGGGRFGPALRGAGYDGIFVYGIAPKPVYLYVDDQHAELRDATTLWGLDTVATEEAIRQATSSDVQVACIGPAGEKRSLISGIVNEGGRIAARCGLGAVMGSKNLKAIAARGRASPPLADKEAFDQSTKGYRQLFRRQPARWMPLMPKFLHAFAPFLRRLRFKPTSGPLQMIMDNYRLYGTASATALLVALDDTPIRNWTGTSVRDYPVSMAENLSDEAVIRNKIKPYACHSCPLACGATIRLPNGGTGHRPEYETLAAFGPLLLNADLDTVVACNEICNLAGLDTISTGVAVAFAIECSERGWLPPELAGELPLHWGDSQAIVELTKRIAARQPGLGEWLADGIRHAASRASPAAQEAAVHAGGQELPMHRGLYEPGVAVGYWLDPAPGRHTATLSGMTANPTMIRYLKRSGRQLAARYDYSAKGAEMAVVMQVLRAFDSLGMCQFSLLMGEPPILDWLQAATGWEVSEADFLRLGWRIQALRHAFNAREGITPEQVKLPARERGDPPLEAGPLAGITLDTGAMSTGYFSVMGIDPATGWPSPETVQILGLEALLHAHR
ncbi:MAG: aldehyde ferredoxin oxidoreductase family protein [Chloroflexi bacterium]|nr:aldehyde ferredoxin oxidoreductase family protein [Chloroflexota bacterium]